MIFDHSVYQKLYLENFRRITGLEILQIKSKPIICVIGEHHVISQKRSAILILSFPEPDSKSSLLAYLEIPIVYGKNGPYSSFRLDTKCILLGCEHLCFQIEITNEFCLKKVASIKTELASVNQRIRVVKVRRSKEDKKNSIILVGSNGCIFQYLISK